MADAALQVPTATERDYPEHVRLIVESESMNGEERQYWINILPAMSPAQRQSLLDILLREKQQLQAIDRRYAQTARQAAPESAERQKKRSDLSDAEAKAERTEEAVAQDLLEQIDTLT